MTDQISEIEFLPYIVKGPLGVEFPAKSVVIPLEENLLVVSPGEFDAGSVERIKGCGLAPVFVAPNNFHHVHLGKAKENFPDAPFYGPIGAARKGKINLLPMSEFKLEGVETLEIKGHDILGETCFYVPLYKTLITTDLVFNLRDPMSLGSKILFSLDGKRNRVAFSKILKAVASDKKQFIASARSLLDFPFETAVLGHGESISRRQFELALPPSL